MNALFFQNRSTGKAYDFGDCVTQPPEMTNSGNGVYFPSILDMSSVSNFPFRYACYFSTDHTSTTDDGIYLYLTNALLDVDQWISYTDAVTQGYFDYLTTKPTSNPIYVDNVGNQTETPCLRIVDGTIVMTYHNNGVGVNQSTVRTTGTDGINFSGRSVIVDYVSGSFDPGDGHTGYFKWGKNPFKDLNYTYIGYSLYGGGDSPFIAQWGTNDPVAGSWDKLATLQPQGGRGAVGDLIFSHIGLDIGAIIPSSSNTYKCITRMTTPASGITQRKGGIYQVELDSYGREVVSKPFKLLDFSQSSEVSISNVAFIPVGTRIYKGVYEATKLNGERTFASSEVVPAHRNADFEHSIPTTTDYTFDFKNETTLSSSFNQLQTGASDASFTSDGMIMTASDGDNIIIYFNTAFIPSSVKFFEIFVKRFRTTSTSRARQINFGFSKDQTFLDSIVDGFVWGSNGSNLGYTSQGVNSGVVTKTTEPNNEIGYNNSATAAWHETGLRWFVDEDKMYQLGFEGGEVYFDLNATVSGVNKSVAYYPFISLKSDAGEVSELLESLTIRYGA